MKSNKRIIDSLDIIDILLLTIVVGMLIFAFFGFQQKDTGVIIRSVLYEEKK
jgi:hypothetical protein